MKKLFVSLIVALTFLMTSCFVEEYATYDPSGYPYVTAPQPYPYYYYTYPRYYSPYYSPNFHRPTPPPPRPHYNHPNPHPQPPHYNHPNPHPQPPHNPNNGQRAPRPQVTPRPSTPNPPTPRPNTNTSRQSHPSAVNNKPSMQHR